jgi:hypothetical protein
MFLAWGSEESELERLGSATRCEGTFFWMGLDASGMVLG